MNKKYKINLDYFTYSTIINDIEAFRFFKKDESTNKNLFINKLIYNYHYLFNKNIDTYESYLKEIFKEKKLNNNDINDLIEKISRANIKKEEIKEKDYPLTFVTTSKYESVFIDIEDNYLSRYSFSEYIRMLLISYSKKNQDERERVLFKEEIDLINNAIKENKKIIFSFNNELIESNPIGIFSTKDHQFLYLVYYYKTNYYPLNLYKLTSLRKSRNIKDELTKEEIDKLKELLKGDVEFISPNYIDVKVEFSKEGIKKYKKIFINRPNPYKKEDNIYYFYASSNQLFFYLSRFGKDVKILNNKSLQSKLYFFYKEGMIANRNSEK